VRGKSLRGKHPKQSQRARSLRRSATQAELTLWLKLRDRRLSGFKFVRQERIGRYYVDFVCREQRLVVEVDGGQHAESFSDQQRDKVLEALGYRIVRIWNDAIFENIDGVLEMLSVELTKAPHPDPLPASGARE